jgi:hypothetical protein
VVARPRVAIVVGLLFPLILPWGFWRTGKEIWELAQEPATASVSFWPLYLQVLYSFRFFLIAFAFASTGRLLVAWGAVRSSKAHTQA